MTLRKTPLFLIPAALLALLLGACASGQGGAGDGIQNGVIVDDLRAPSRDY